MLELRSPSSLALGHWFLGFQTKSALTPLALPHATPSSQGFRLRLNFTTSSPDSPTCRWQLAGLLSFHNHKSHEILSVYTYTHTHTHLYVLISSISLENPNIVANNSSSSNTSVPLCPVRLGVRFPSFWIWSIHVICFIYESDKVLTLSLTFKKAGCFSLGAPGIQLPYKKLELDYW